MGENLFDALSQSEAMKHWLSLSVRSFNSKENTVLSQSQFPNVFKCFCQ